MAHPFRSALPHLSLLRLQLQPPELLQSIARLAVIPFSRLFLLLPLCLEVTATQWTVRSMQALRSWRQTDGSDSAFT